MTSRRRVRHWVTVTSSDDDYEREVLEAETRSMLEEDAALEPWTLLAEIMEEGRDSLTDEQAATLAQFLHPRKK